MQAETPPSFSVAEECVRMGLRAGAILFRGVRVVAVHAALRAEIAHEVRVLQGCFENVLAVRNLPEVVSFQELLRKAGVNPRKEQPSLERLLAFALKRGELPTINSLVDAYNVMSVRSRCSLGAHDLDKITPPVALRLLSGEESFTPLGGKAPVPVARGEYGYVDATNRVLCRLDILQAEFSKVTTETVNALLIIEGTDVHARDFLRQVFGDAIDLILQVCGGTAEIVAYA
jgi:DNA/RNA-binding domain of Phe-tRNA-synthetase-like protein